MPTSRIFSTGNRRVQAGLSLASFVSYMTLTSLDGITAH